MSVSISPRSAALLIVAFSLLVQVGFALGVFGPAWLSPVLSLPALAAIAWLWRRAEQKTHISEAFTRLVL